MKRDPLAMPVPEATATDALQLRHVSIAIGGRALFAPLDLSIAGGECVTLMGPKLQVLIRFRV